MLIKSKGVTAPLLIGMAGIGIFVILMDKMPDNTISAIIQLSPHEFNINLFPYHHAIDQLEWLIKYSHNNVSVLIQYHDGIPLHFQSDLSVGKIPTIFYDRKFLYHPTSPDGCRYKCHFPTSIGSLTKGDAAVFSASFSTQTASELKELGVIVAFETGESPVHMPKLSTKQLGQIDLFITYMATSPVPYLYPIFVRNVTPKLKFARMEVSKMSAENSTHLLPPYHRNRTKLIAWVVSNPHPSNNRIQFAEAISQFIPVDIYGRGKMPLSRDRNTFRYLSKTYKFYLAFENSNCKDYITEKAQINALSNDMVPIVLGAFKEDYENALPPHSFINVDDFASIKKLTEYLQYLDKNDTAYATYFAWKKYGRIVALNRPDCRLCGFVHQLNAGKISLPKPDPSLFTDPNKLCFNRPLLPLV